ncbi:helicase-related protein [Paenibacillus sp. tmac-D7]|uniref:helicase-related protein n=1 Tax=Paenibacillus sp. tmac-D7 TaxID=2591462 RepID=UPI001143A735|nr:helicase-related protein [Paenibacillus sp. tmac-D7]
MLKLEDIKKDSIINGLLPIESAKIIMVEQVGPDALSVVYRSMSGTIQERMLFRSDETNLSLAQVGRPWSFDADEDAFKLAAEAYRINVAHLFDPMMAVHTSNVEPLPHQITAVYESMLPRQPLRFVLADDPGAGKTIMAGLLMRELMIRADAKRILIIAPGSLVEQWQDELYEKFDLEFDLFTRELEKACRSGNPFEERDLMVVRLDQLSRSEELQEKLKATHWDLIVVDEAHKMSANWYGQKVNETKRFKLGKLAGSITRHFLLMTATPHNGKEEDFQLFLSLLDSDRFYGKFRDGVQQVEVSDLMRRMVKEELYKFDGTKLFPERRAITVNYKLSEMEAALYAKVTNYVKEEMDKADKLEDKKRKGTVGFALTSLQRRLASSPEAIYQSLKKRKERLERRIEEMKVQQRGRVAWETTYEVPDDIYESDEEMTDTQYEEFEEEVVSQATAAQTIQELEKEIQSLKQLEQVAREVVQSNQDTKWSELSSLLLDEPMMRDASGNRRKMIIFTEHRDTLNYLENKISGLLGNAKAVETIHGGVKREDRRKVQELFRHDPDTLVLIATDAAGEGVNLQNANLMVNYDLPWNPNRLEQRFGRIHRIGQTEVCHLWNMVAAETREGDVFQRLLNKLEIEREALGGRVFDILGKVFEHRSLRELLIDAIRYGDREDVKAQLQQQVEGALSPEHLRDILNRNALTEEVMTLEQMYKVKDEMEKAQARRLQPYFIRAFFREAFSRLGGDMKERERERYEISHVPAVIRERDRQISGRVRNRKPVLTKYERVCFEKQLIRVKDKREAALIHSGHPLMQAVTDLILERERGKLKQGTVLIDESDDGTTPKMLFMVEHTVRENDFEHSSREVSRRIQFVSIDEQGNAVSAGYAPHLDLRKASAEERNLVSDVLQGQWITGDLEGFATRFAAGHIGMSHYEEIKQRRELEVNRTLKAVHERLIVEINYWQDRYLKLQEDIAAGKQPRVQLENVRRTIDDLTARLEQRHKELEAKRHIISATPIIIGGALVIPAGLLAQRRGQQLPVDAASRKRIELLAMQAVMDAERQLGHEVIDVSADKCGWDITARVPQGNARYGQERHIEVKGRAKGQDTITVTRNEMLYGLNQGDKFVLAIVIVDGDKVDGPYYIRNPFQERPDWAEVSKNLDIGLLLERAERVTTTNEVSE